MQFFTNILRNIPCLTSSLEYNESNETDFSLNFPQRSDTDEHRLNESDEPKPTAASLEKNHEAKQHEQVLQKELLCQVSDKSKQSTVDVWNTFAHKFHLKLAEKYQKTIAFSPLSLLSALSIALSTTSDKQTKERLKDFLGTKIDEKQFHKEISCLLQRILGACNTTSTALTCANLVLTRAVEPDAGFKEFLQKTYTGDIVSIGENCGADIINKFVSDATKGEIPILFQQDELARLNAAIVNAVYFNGKWRYPFQPSETTQDDFSFGTSTGKVMFMADIHKYKVMTDQLISEQDTSTFSTLVLPYRVESGSSNMLSLAIFKPASPTNLPELEKALTPEFVKKSLFQCVMKNCEVRIPLLNIDQNTDILPILKEMGMPDIAFDAIYSGNAKMDAAKHALKLKVHEAGTVASAATALVSQESAIVKHVPTININSSFVFMLMQGDTVLFQGSVKDPSALVKFSDYYANKK